MISYKLRMTGRQHGALQQHLYPGDGKEAISFAICGVGEFVQGEQINRVVMINEIFPIPYDQCSAREVDYVTWSSEYLPEIITKAEKQKMVILKIHSHPNGYNNFSKRDDESDVSLFPRLAEWLDTDFPGISAVMIPDGSIFARAFDDNGCHQPVESVLVAGGDIKYWEDSTLEFDTEEMFRRRTLQAFGKGTTQILRKLSIGVVGISGTGSPVVEQLFRLGVGKLVLVDGDVIKDVNLGRIYNSTVQDAKDKKKKVDVIADTIERSGLPTRVERVPYHLFKESVLRRLSQCDIIFGCMDSVEGRDILNKICTFYSIPYFDLGVQLNADGMGGVEQISCAVHYLQPDGPSLLQRGVYNAKTLTAEVVKRTNPTQYELQKKEGYLKGIEEESPAVISVNTLIAAHAVNELLSRLHDIRLDSNDEIDCVRVSLTNCYVSYEKVKKEVDTNTLKFTGRGDMSPLLNTIIRE